VNILWHGIGPWHRTGYGIGTALYPPRLRGLGHQVAIAVMGEQGARHPLTHPGAAETKRTGLWDGMRVIGPGPSEFAMPARDRVRDACGGEPDLVLVLKDAWVLRRTAANYKPYRRTAVWLAYDTEPLGVPDREFFTCHAPDVRPVCLSRRGFAQARQAGLGSALYVPFGIDTGFWQPGDRHAARDLLRLPHDVFVAGIDAANIGPRKAWGEQLAAFAAFRARHPRSMLLVHSAKKHPEGINLCELAYSLGLAASPDPDQPQPGDAVWFGSHTNMTPAQMLSWYRCLDVLMAATYGEGSGLPITQAQAVGVPVIGTDCSAITEKIPHGTGWLVKGQRWWNPHHQAWWTIPSVTGLTTALGHAYRRQHAGPAVIRDHAVAGWDADRVTKEFWVPALEELTA
jgi:glycosyltransferase involved in cell wall biosynthesis